MGKECFAAYFFQGACEYVFPGHPLPSIIEPMGAVPKEGPDEYRHIADARRGNKWLADWGVRYFSARDLAFALSWRAIVNGHDINDCYHIAVLAGCTGQLVWGWGIVRVEHIHPGDADFEPRGRQGNTDPQGVATCRQQGLWNGLPCTPSAAYSDAGRASTSARKGVSGQQVARHRSKTLHQFLQGTFNPIRAARCVT